MTPFSILAVWSLGTRQYPLPRRNEEIFSTILYDECSQYSLIPTAQSLFRLLYRMWIVTHFVFPIINKRALTKFPFLRVISAKHRGFNKLIFPFLVHRLSIITCYPLCTKAQVAILTVSQPFITVSPCLNGFCLWNN